MKRLSYTLALGLALLMLTSGLVQISYGASPRLTPAQQKVSKFSESLLEPTKKLLSGYSSLVVEKADFRLVSKAEALGMAESLGSPILQGAAAAALVPFRSPGPKFSRNVLVSTDSGQVPIQTEPHIAVDPKDPDHIVVAVIDYNSPNVVAYVSIDRGATWEGPFQPRYLADDIGAGGDPVVAFSRDGSVFIGSISIDVEEFHIGGYAYADIVSSIVVSRSDDGGFTWSRPVKSSRSAINIPGDPPNFIELGFLDKPWMSVGPDPKDPNKDIVYVTYTHFVIRYDIGYIFGGELFTILNPVVETTIELVKSEDGGKTWSKSLKVSPTVRKVYTGISGGEQFGYIDRTVQGSQPVVDPSGNVYVAWLDSTDDAAFKGNAEIWVAKSTDVGKTFSRPVRAASFLEPDFSPRTAFFRSWGSAFPQITVGPKGEIYIVFTGRPPTKPTDDGDIYYTRSEDGGRTWTTVKRINDDNTDRFQFFPSITVDPKAVIHAMWGDFRDDKTEKSFHIYYTKSEDGGKTWIENARVTDFPTNPNRAFPRGAFIGDYFAIKATKDDVFMVWADGRLGEFGGYNQKIGFARSTLMPNPSIFLSPPRGPGGKDIVIQGSNFQPEKEIFVEVSGAIVAGGRSNRDGRFAMRIFVPISGEGAHEIRVFDASGNLAAASFFMEFGFDSQKAEFKKVEDSVSKAVGSVNAALERIQKAPPQPATDEILNKFDAKLASLNRDVSARVGGAEENFLSSLSEINYLLTIVAALAVVAIAVSVASVVLIIRRK